MSTVLLNGMPVVITPGSKMQNRTHKKKRINKKWAKRYGYTYHEVIEDGKILICNENTLYMNQKTHEDLHKTIGRRL